MTNRRNKIQIINDILIEIKTSGNELKISRLIFKTNLTHTRIKKYLQEMCLFGYIINKNKRYALTEKGNNLINEFNKVKNIIDAFVT
jgi:predicted transcriptional regulator